MAGRHSSRVNAFDGIALTRLDILTGFAELQVCIAYEVDGQTIDYFPSQVETLANAAARCTRRFPAGTSR